MNTWLSTFRIWMIWKYNMNIYNRTFKSTVFPSSGVFITNADFEYLCYNSHLSLVFSFKQFIIYPSFLSMAWQIYSRTCTAMFSFRLFFAIVLYMYRHNSNIRHIKSENLSDCLLVLQLPWVDWSQVLSWEWRCSWSSADRQCSNYIWVINNFITNSDVSYIRDLTVCYFPNVLGHTCVFSDRFWTRSQTETRYFSSYDLLMIRQKWFRFPKTSRSILIGLSVVFMGPFY